MVIIRIFRLFRLITVVALFFIKAVLIHITTADPHLRRKRFEQNVTDHSDLALKALNVELKVTNPPMQDQTYLIVSNHLGYLDIFAIAAAIPSLFVTSVEMKETPFLGWLTEMGGCMYVERRNRNNILSEIKEIEAALNDGFNVVLYPEGRSTNGEKVLPFKKSLLMACADSNAHVMPAVVNFRFVNGEPVQSKHRDWLCWYDDMPFITSIWNATQINHCLMTLDFLDVVHVNGDSNHKDIATKAQNQIEARFIPLSTADLQGIS